MSCDDIYCTGSCAECVERERQSMLDDLDSANARISALEGLLRECQPHVEARAVQEIENGYTNDHARLRALLSRLDAALTPDRDKP